MVTTVVLSDRLTKKYSMDEQDLWYLSGVLDSIATITVKVRHDKSYQLNHEMLPAVMISRPQEVEALFAMLEQYCIDQGVKFAINEQHNSRQMEITTSDEIEKFLKPVAGGFLQQAERVNYYLEEILPELEDGNPEDSERFVELMGKIDTLREYPISPKESKFDQEYFIEEWGDEISQ